MRSLYVIKPGELEWRDVPAPRLGGPREALVEPIAASTCDFDRPLIEGRPHPYAGRLPFKPFAFGHEAVARVVEVGRDVRSVKPGDVVAVPWHINCGECGRCRRGLTAFCEKFPDMVMRIYGTLLTEDFGGLFDDVVRVPFADAMLVKVPPGIDPAEAVSAGDNMSHGRALVAPHLAAGRRRVLVLGFGGNGLYAAAFAVALGAECVVYVDDDAGNRAIAESYGATAFAGPPDRAHGRFDLVVDAAFQPPWLSGAVDVLEHDGMIECLGHLAGDVTLPGRAMYWTGVNFHCSQCSSGPHIAPALELVADGTITPSLVWSKRVSWDDLPAAIAAGGRKVVGVRSPVGDAPPRPRLRQ
jgi:threonine dehydrogenase-like Zn-dependent dehydrogenase